MKTRLRITLGTAIAAFTLVGLISTSFTTLNGSAEATSSMTPKKKKGESELEWRNWNEGVKKAKKADKLLLIDVYTDWCGWCKVMDKKTYSEASVIKAIEEDFIPVKFNPEIKDVKYTYNEVEYTGEELLRALTNGTSYGYPTTLFLDVKTSTVIGMVGGFREPEAFKGDMQTVLAEAKSKK